MTAFNEEFRPDTVIMVYKSDHNYYLEQHAIREDGTLTSGQPLRKATVARIADNFTTKKIRSLEKKKMILKGYVPHNVIYMDQNFNLCKIMWWKPESKERLSFTEQSKIPSGLASVPNMVFVWDNSLSVYAVKDVPVTLDTRLYHAPFPNVYKNGSVCMGSAETKGEMVTYQDAMNIQEARFFHSKFTAEGLDRKLATISIVELWKENIKKKQTFNYNYLIPHDKGTIRDLIEDQKTLSR
jgi:PRTRC genetic system protein B